MRVASRQLPVASLNTWHHRCRAASRRFVAALEALSRRIAPSGGGTEPIILDPIPVYPIPGGPPTLPCDVHLIGGPP